MTYVNGPVRYARLLYAFARCGMIREMTFRGNFLIKVLVEALWLCFLLVFYRTVFANTSRVADWTEPQYLFFLGCYFTLEGLMETLFLTNCNEFADLVRTGDLDFYLLKPIDEQFLVTCRYIEWSTVPNLAMGVGLMGVALVRMGWVFDPLQASLFVLLFGCGMAITYSFLVFLTSMSVWMMRNQSLYELWWLVTSLMRYPKEIFADTWFAPVSWFFTFIVPILIIVNVPARGMVKVFEPALVFFTLAATVVLIFASRRFFRYALQKYRSASS
jgi:ABC-2 type transport system permease protein